MDKVSFNSFICFFPVGGVKIIYSMNTAKKPKNNKTGKYFRTHFHRLAHLLTHSLTYPSIHSLIHPLTFTKK